MLKYYSVLLFFFIFGLFNVNSCDCCKGNKSSKSASSDAKSGSPLIDISGRKTEQLVDIDVEAKGSSVGDYDVYVFENFFKVNRFNLKALLNIYSNQGKIRVFFKEKEDVGNNVIIFVSSYVVSNLSLDTNKAELHKLNDHIYYFYYF